MPGEVDMAAALALLNRIADDIAGLREDMRAKPQAHQQAPRRTIGSPVGGGGVVRFGRDKGKALSDCADLTWYRKAIAENVEDPAKARYRADNEAHLAEIDAAMGKPAAAPPAENWGGFPAGPPDEDVPF